MNQPASLDLDAWGEGFAAGRAGMSGWKNPYAAGSVKALAWYGGYVAGRAKSGGPLTAA